MRVLLAATSTLPDRMGGSERVIWHLARGLVARGHEPRILVPRTTRTFPAVSRVDGITILRYYDPFHSFATLYLPSLALARKFVRVAVRAWRPDVVHAHHGISGLGARWAGARSLCYTFYGPWHLEFLHEAMDLAGMSALKRRTRSLWMPAKAALARRFEHAAVRRSDRVIALSTYSVRQLEAIHDVAASQVTLIPGGVDLKLFAPTLSRGAARESLGLPLHGPLLFTVRRLVPRMGLERLLQALAMLQGARLVIGGSGWLRSRLEAEASQLAISGRVHFPGFIKDEDLPRYYQAADLVVLPSVALEGFGLITLEALACGRPVVATAESGASDVLGLLEPSWLVDEASPEALARVISRALDYVAGDPTVPERCRAHAEAYSWDRMAEKHEGIYRSLSGAR